MRLSITITVYFKVVMRIFLITGKQCLLRGESGFKKVQETFRLVDLGIEGIFPMTIENSRGMCGKVLEFGKERKL